MSNNEITEEIELINNKIDILDSIITKKFLEKEGKTYSDDDLKSTSFHYKSMVSAESSFFYYIYLLFIPPIVGIIYFFSSSISTELMILLICFNPLYFFIFLAINNIIKHNQEIYDMKLYKIRKEYLSEIILLKEEICNLNINKDN